MHSIQLFDIFPSFTYPPTIKPSALDAASPTLPPCLLPVQTLPLLPCPLPSLSRPRSRPRLCFPATAPSRASPPTSARQPPIAVTSDRLSSKSASIPPAPATRSTTTSAVEIRPSLQTCSGHRASLHGPRTPPIAISHHRPPPRAPCRSPFPPAQHVGGAIARLCRSRYLIAPHHRAQPSRPHRHRSLPSLRLPWVLPIRNRFCTPSRHRTDGPHLSRSISLRSLPIPSPCHREDRCARSSCRERSLA